jgi:Glycosyl transferase family 41
MTSLRVAGTTTTCESLFMGVPCVSLAGRCHAHNVGLSLLTAVGMCDWVARTRAEYVRLAAAWAAKPGELAALRRRLRERMLRSPLCDAPPFLRALEQRYRECFERWRAGGSGSGDAVTANGRVSQRSSVSGEPLLADVEPTEADTPADGSHLQSALGDGADGGTRGVEGDFGLDKRMGEQPTG